VAAAIRQVLATPSGPVTAKLYLPAKVSPTDKIIDATHEVAQDTIKLSMRQVLFSFTAGRSQPALSFPLNQHHQKRKLKKIGAACPVETLIFRASWVCFVSLFMLDSNIFSSVLDKDGVDIWSGNWRTILNSLSNKSISDTVSF
jgi:hypothetical protein